MINNEIISFINKVSVKGTSREQIRAALIADGGWTAQDVDEAFRAIDTPKLSEKISADKVKEEDFSDTSVSSDIPRGQEASENKNESIADLPPENDFVDLSGASFKDVAEGSSLSVNHPDAKKKSKIPTPLVFAFIVFALIASFLIWPSGEIKVSPQVLEQQQRDMEKMIQESQSLLNK
ncbi:MAG: hypothetical protein WC878_04815 [Candidatus Paceibacterota bacterium]